MNVKDHITDEDTRAATRPAGWWGRSAAIDVKGCDLPSLEDEATVRAFMAALVGAIDMKAYGDPLVALFGEGELHGLTAVQLIYTSSITWHASGGGRPECYLDVFSCKSFDVEVAAAVATAWFGGTATVRGVIERGVRP